MKRIHLPNMGPVTGNIPKAIGAAVKECQSIGAQEVALITPLKNNLDTLVIGEFLGEAVAKRLMKGESIPIGKEGVSLIHGSVATITKGRPPRVGLAFYVSRGDIQKLDDLRFDVLIYVPWLDKDGQVWAAKWGAETLGAQTRDQDIDLPAEVIEALQRLTRCVNLSTGLGHPSDKTNAKRQFTNLRAAGLHWRPSELEKWAVRNGWRAADAEELATLSARYT